MAIRELFAASALIASALAVSAPAQATSFTGMGYSDIADGTGAFFSSNIPTGSFTDTITFDLFSAGAQDVNLVYFKTTSGISDLKAWFNDVEISFEPIGGKSFTGSLATPVTAGLQTLRVTGVSAGRGSYSGNVTFSSAVPEVATWLMMIAGIGFTGVALRRRQSAPKVQYAF